MTNNLQQLDKNGEIFLKFFWGCEPISLFGRKTGCTLLLRRTAPTQASAGYPLPSGSPWAGAQGISKAATPGIVRSDQNHLIEVLF